jgi:hypothetical protein
MGPLLDAGSWPVSTVRGGASIRPQLGGVKRTSPGYRRSEEIDPEWIPRRFGFGAKIKKPTSVGTYVDLSLFRSPLPRDSEGHEPP